MATGDEDETYVRRWIDVVRANPVVIRTVLGGIMLNVQVVVAEFLGARLGLSPDDLVPTMLAAATGGVIQAAHTRWYLEGGDRWAILSGGLEVLERLGGDLRALVAQAELAPRD